ncbi:MAG: transposase [Sandaracinaceae bacterium]|nr:transposase [Sandaracinaceae bacterium]
METLCELAFEPRSQGGRPSLAPGVYFRMLLLGYFEGIESERGICWRCEDSLSLKRFLGFEPHESTPDHSTLSRMRTRLPESTYVEVFRFVMRVLNERGLLRGQVAGVDATYLRADASMKTIVRKGSGEGYKGYLRRLAKGPASRTRPKRSCAASTETAKARRRRMKSGQAPPTRTLRSCA